MFLQSLQYKKSREKSGPNIYKKLRSLLGKYGWSDQSFNNSYLISKYKSVGKRKKKMNRNKEIQKIINLLCVSFVIVFFINCSNKSRISQMVFPKTSWEEKSPSSLGVDPAVLDSALSYFRKISGGVGTDEMVLVRNGYIIWKGQDVTNKHELFSATKTFTSTIMGILATNGKIDINDPVVNYYPKLDDGDEGQEAYAQIRFRDLATMTAGYQSISDNCWQLHLKGLHKESYECTQFYTIPGKPEYPPRTMINYDDQNVHMLGYVLIKIAGKSLEEIFRQEIADKIGITNWDWSDYGYRDGMFFNNPAGTPNDLEANDINEIQAGIHTTALDFARFGLLYLNKGKWADQQLIDSDFTEAAISNQVDVSLPNKGPALQGRYGFYWWTNGIQRNGKRPWPSAPPKTATALGHFTNYCFVIPEWNMVIVRMSPRYESPLPEYGDTVWEEFFKILKAGITITDI